MTDMCASSPSMDAELTSMELHHQGLNVPGRPVSSAELYLYDYKDASLPDAEALQRVSLVGFPGGDDDGADFHTLGFAYDEQTSTLYVSNHARAGSRIEVFALDLDARTATHRATLRHPLLHGPNALVLLGPGELLVTNDHRFPARDYRLLAQVETYLGTPTGTVVHVKLDVAPLPNNKNKNKGSSSTYEIRDARVLAHVPFANGLELLNRSTVAVASTSRAAVYLFTLSGRDDDDDEKKQQTTSSSSSSSKNNKDSGKRDKLKMKYKTQIRTPFHPDNLSLTADGRLLIAGHPHTPSLERFAATRYVCNDAAELALASDETRRYCADGSSSTTPSWAAEWTEARGLRSLYAGVEYPSSATAAWDVERGVGIVAGLYAKGLLVWRD
ncbi:hypothetical protein JDV02_010592 [Purpureocillium takamizusanense]|uniref:Uncharacterized protein n=1 Tax=Purpureocillium takamizusanense TaxID=2060973 RepID=A0A9Q8VGQ3_9HYPO|nr:uncharacterized protein JDV02_010592 [Purpureocillium takamizusanense]UNI24873.1 hypothetical protein JDV02_010592 [Purpureocillium takamizusanense]